MNITEYIINEIGALSLNSTINSAQKICETFPITHIPVVENKKLIGCFAESDIRTIENLKRELREYSDLLIPFNANEKTTLLELLSIFADNDSNLIPVVDQQQNYIGYYDLTDILDAFASCPFLQRDNETLIVTKPKQDFSMSEVAQIVESNGVKLLGLYISEETLDNVKVTLKMSSEKINEIIQTFRRYDYHVITRHIDDQYLEELKDRARYFNRYLDI